MIIKENSTILIPIDFSKQSLIAVKHSYNLARFTHSKLILLNVYKQEAFEHADELENLAKTTRAESGLDVEIVNRKGDLYDVTDAVATENKCNLIIAGLDSHVRFRSFMGTNIASKFIKNAPCPVITIRSANTPTPCKNIVMPFDTSAESREKVGLTVQIAKYYGADIRIVSVFHPSDAKYENELLPYLHQVKKFIKEKGVNCTNKSIPSTMVAETIIEYANKNDCDLIIQMNKKDVSLGEMFSGTMSQKIVDLSNIPVLSVNPMVRESMSHFGSGM